MARALQFLLWEDFGVVTTNFYDDYPTLELAGAAENTTQVVSGFVPALACFTTGLLSFYWRTYPLTYFAVKFPSSCYR